MRAGGAGSKKIKPEEGCGETTKARKAFGAVFFAPAGPNLDFDKRGRVCEVNSLVRRFFTGSAKRPAADPAREKCMAKPRALFFVCVALATILAAIPSARAESPPLWAEEGELVRVVVLSRHGLRSPTQSPETLADWSARAWPVWPVQRGWLTERGARLASAMWKNLRICFEHAGIALAPPQVFVRADTDQRTQATARAILDGLGLTSAPYAVAEHGPDPLFHPLKAGVCALVAEEARQDILRQAGGDLDRLAREWDVSLQGVNRLAAPLGPELCREWGLPQGCGLADLPNLVETREHGQAVNLRGGLAIASSLAEIFLLEYGEWPDRLPAWGKADAAVLREVLPLHNRVFDLLNRAPAVAAARGSALLREMEAALLGYHADPRVNQARLTVFVGHDTNIANLAGLLDLRWQLPGHGNNAIPPAAVLAFELRRRGTRQEIRALFCAQSLETLHGWSETAPLDEAAPICRPAELSSGEAARYSPALFSQIVRAALRPECLPGQVQLRLRERP